MAQAKHTPKSAIDDIRDSLSDYYAQSGNGHESSGPQSSWGDIATCLKRITDLEKLLKGANHAAAPDLLRTLIAVCLVFPQTTSDTQRRYLDEADRVIAKAMEVPNAD